MLGQPDTEAIPDQEPLPATEGVAEVIPIDRGLRDHAREAVRPLAERAAEPPVREAGNPAGLPKPKFRSPWSEDFPSPRCRIADARKGAEVFGGIYWLFDAIPMALYVLLVCPLAVLKQRPARFWGVVLLVLLFVLFRFG